MRLIKAMNSYLTVLKQSSFKIEIISSYDVVYPSRNIQIGEIIIE